MATSNCTDYRQITGTFGISLNGEFPPIQLIYQGKTERCHPKFKFPEEFHVAHTKNHLYNEEKSKELVTKILIPFVKKKIAELKLRKNQEWLLISDVFKGHWTEQMKALVSSSNGKMIPVPNNLTNEFQPLDLTVNRTCKAFFRKESQEWFASQVQLQIENGVTPEEVKVDKKISILKPLHAKWVTSFYDKMQSRPDIALRGWKRFGITNFLQLDSSKKKEDPFV